MEPGFEGYRVMVEMWQFLGIFLGSALRAFLGLVWKVDPFVFWGVFDVVFCFSCGTPTQIHGLQKIFWMFYVARNPP